MRTKLQRDEERLALLNHMSRAYPDNNDYTVAIELCNTLDDNTEVHQGIADELFRIRKVLED